MNDSLFDFIGLLISHYAPGEVCAGNHHVAARAGRWRADGAASRQVRVLTAGADRHGHRHAVSADEARAAQLRVCFAGGTRHPAVGLAHPGVEAGCPVQGLAAGTARRVQWRVCHGEDIQHAWPRSLVELDGPGAAADRLDHSQMLAAAMGCRALDTRSMMCNS